MPSSNIRIVQPPKKQANPIWRGIGCIIMIILPLVTFGLTVLLTPIVAVAAKDYLPYELVANANFPLWTYQTPILTDIVTFFHGINFLWLGMLVFVIILTLLTGISSLIYVSVMQVIGPPRYSEKDAPPPSYKGKAYKR